MSSALNTAIYKRLTGIEVLTGTGLTAQTALASLLAVDAAKARPAVHYGNKRKAVLLPAITFRPGGGTPDPRFTADTGVMGGPIYDFEFWENGSTANKLADIEEQVERLLDRRRYLADPIALTSGALFWSEALTEMTLLYDETRDLWAGLKRYRFIEARHV